MTEENLELTDYLKVTPDGIKITKNLEAKGSALIAALEEAADNLGYPVTIKPLRKTNSRVATWGWGAFGPLCSKDFKYNGQKSKDVDPRVKSIRVTVEYPVDCYIFKRDVFGNQLTEMCTVEAFIDEMGYCRAVPIETYNEDGFVQSVGLQGIVHRARAKPARKDDNNYRKRSLAVKELLKETKRVFHQEARKK